MRKHSLIFTASVTLFCFLVLTFQQSLAQPPAAGRSQVAVRKVDGKKESTPIYSVKGPNAGSRAKDWFRVFVEYDTDAEWIDELNFTFYVLVKGKTKDAPAYSLFKGETAYIHVAKGSRHQADMFLHPNILTRFGDVERVAVEVRQGGRLLERVGKPNPTEAWWEKLSPIDGVLLNRSQTPFVFVDIDDYEIIKSK